MKLKILTIGRTQKGFLKESLDDYLKRLNHMMTVEYLELAPRQAVYSQGPVAAKKAEAGLLLDSIRREDFVILLDEKGKEFTSIQFSAWMQKIFHVGKPLVFISGGPFGFDESVRRRADFTMALSKMTFTHQMVRVIFLEQLFRAMKIMRNEKYHY